MNGHEAVPQANNNLSPQKMFRELSVLFHPDKKGDHEMMVQLNEAYELAKEGKTQRLEELYNEWSGDKEIKLERITSELKKLSHKLYEQAMTKRSMLWEWRIIHDKYKEMCQAQGIKYDRELIAKFLYDEGWIAEEEVETFGKVNKYV